MNLHPSMLLDSDEIVTSPHSVPLTRAERDGALVLVARGLALRAAGRVLPLSGPDDFGRPDARVHSHAALADLAEMPTHVLVHAAEECVRVGDLAGFAAVCRSFLVPR